MATCPTCQAPVEGDALFCPRDGTPLGARAPGTGPSRSGAAPMTPMPIDPLVGRVLGGRYRLAERLGQGGMGTVYRAVHTLMDKPCAIKILRGDLAGDPEAVARFHREARSASRLDHEHCIRVTDFGQSDDGLLYLAMELLDGRSLASLCKQGPLDASHAAAIALAIGRALGHAHEQGVIHRDLKPDNVYLAKRRGGEVVKVLDFGLAKIAGESMTGPSLTKSGVVFGTPEYMAPEQAAGGDLDARTDLYALGIILYQMLTGELPFRAQSFLALLTKQVQEPPQRPRARRPDVAIPDGLEAIVMRCLEKKADDRFADAEALCAALVPFAAAGGLASDGSIASLPPLRVVAAPRVTPPTAPQLAGAIAPESGAAAGGDVASAGTDGGLHGIPSNSHGIPNNSGSGSSLPSLSASGAAASVSATWDANDAGADRPSVLHGEVVPRRQLGRGIALGVGGLVVLALGVGGAVLLGHRPPPAGATAATTREVAAPSLPPLEEARRLLDADDLDAADKILATERARRDGVELQLLLGDLAVRRGNRLGGLAHFHRATRLAPTSPEPHARLASLLALLGQRDAACREAHTALSRDGKSSAARAAATAAGCKD